MSAAALPGRAILLVNRLARRSHGAWRESVRATLARRFHVEERHPRTAAETTDQAHELSRAGDAVVIAAGGDGTINAVANGLAHGAALGILPLGTANDLARQLGIPRSASAAAERIATGSATPMDLGEVNGRRFCTVGGMGLVSLSTTLAARLKQGGAAARVASALLGGGVYKLAATASLLGPRAGGRGTIRWRDPDTGEAHERAIDVHGMFVTNTSTCGGGLVIPTGGRSDDGILEFALVPATTRLRLLLEFGRLSAGRRVSAGTLDVIRAAQATICTVEEEVFVADGDVMATGREFTVRALPGAVAVVR